MDLVLLVTVIIGFVQILCEIFIKTMFSSIRQNKNVIFAMY